MRILWLSPWLRPIARNCAEALISLGHEVMLVTSDLHPESSSARPYETVLLGRPVPNKDWTNILRAFHAARRFKPDIVVTELLRDPRWRIFGGLAPRVRLLHDDKPHDPTHVEPWWIRSFEPWDARADATVVFSDYVAARVREHGAVSPPIHVAPLVTDVAPSCAPDPVPPHQRKNFLLIGRQRPYKNHSVVFEAWDAHVRGSAWRGDQLVLLGQGDIDIRLPPHSRWDRINFRYKDVIDELAHAKGSVVHCRSASQSGVQVMSMQLGVPTLVSTAGALPEYQPPGLSVTGVDDAAGLSRAFDALAEPDEVQIQSAIALDHYTKNYTPSLAAQRMVDIFGTVSQNS